MNIEILNSLSLDEKLNKKIIELVSNDRLNIVYLADKFFNGNNLFLAGKNDFIRLAVCIEALEKTKERYEALGIPDNIFFDTVKDIKIWCENNDNKGLKNYNWISNHIRCELFKIGRLQYQLYICKNKTFDYSLLPFDYGDRLIYIHIPQGEKLVYSDCVNSIRMAIDFFEKYFPDYDYRYFFCESWLLFEDNRLFMNSSSNILQFSALFDIAYSDYDDEQAIERIFGKRKRFISLYPENTSLQKNVKEFLKNKGKLGVGIGYIDKNELKL